MKLVVKNPPVNAGDLREAGSIPGLGRCPGGGHSNPPQDSCLEDPMDRGTWRAIVHGVAKSRTRLKRLGSRLSSNEVGRASQVALVVKTLPTSAGDLREAGSIPGREYPLEEGMGIHSSILA